MKSKLFLSITLLTILFTPTIAFAQERSEEITLSTYYPAPYGEYDELKANWIDVDGGRAEDGEHGRDITIKAQDGGFLGDFDGGDIILQPGAANAAGQPGNVGIGTTSPGAKLHVSGTAGTDGIMFPDGTLQTTATAGGVPAGSIMPYAGSSAPSSWLLCAGQTLTEGGMGEGYEALYNVIGTTYGGSGTSSFKVPDLRGRSPLGKDNMGGSSANRVTNAQADSIGGAAGAETHTLTTAEMPAHTHSVKGHIGLGNGSSPPCFYSNNAPYNTGSKGGGGAHNNMPPYLTLNYIIKY